ncbi:hypothetical protein WH87_16225 [Devosia epidermidihirudinis]|uniref:DUF3828 domain-containing protein n=1 Tax=Devosia epidermidihirudinis TaxID=1293439 RepID=A0A0F5Q404_9HYPH|nr:DUF3828 domain-containing protein [Devosia epidermidihirudinis]KKC35595.1 hypothetical protein WH87_16225 [Devosia epidermidihirudinis]
MRLATIATGLFFACTSFAAAESYQTPQALLEAFYEPYFSGDFADDESQFRSEALQSLYDNDAQNTPEGEMGALGFDPYIDGQDFDITDLEIHTPDISGEEATVEVTFKNFDQPRTLVYDLVNENGWKIDDVASTSPDNVYRLSEIFAEAAGE